MIAMGRLQAAPKMLDKVQAGAQEQVQPQGGKEQQQVVTFQTDGKPRVGKGHMKRMKEDEQEEAKKQRRSQYEEWKRQVLGGSKEKEHVKVSHPIPRFSSR